MNVDRHTTRRHGQGARAETLLRWILFAAGLLVGTTTLAETFVTVRPAVLRGGAAAVQVYADGASGAATPLREFWDTATPLLAPFAVALHPVDPEVVVVDTADIPGISTSPRLLTYASDAVGDSSPLRVISGGNTQMVVPSGVVLDWANDEIFVANVIPGSFPIAEPGPGRILVFDRFADGDVAPVRFLEVDFLSIARQIFVEVERDELFVTTGGEVRAYSRTAQGFTAPLRTITGPATQIGLAQSVFVDTSAGLVYVVDQFSVLVFPVDADGDVSPLQTFPLEDPLLRFTATSPVSAGPAGQLHGIVPFGGQNVLRSYDLTGGSMSLISTLTPPGGATFNAVTTTSATGGAVGFAAPGPSNVSEIPVGPAGLLVLVLTLSVVGWWRLRT